MNFRIGEHVREKEGRHIGRVTAIFSSILYRVVWMDTGWISELEGDELERAP